MRTILLAAAASAAIAGALSCRVPEIRTTVAAEVSARTGAVVAVEPRAATVGAEVLARGGNAVDAAVATALALAVTWPEAGNIGGGGFMLVRTANGEAACIDYRETAPAAARPDMFLDPAGAVDPVRSRLGFLPVGVPGTVAGLALAHERFGRLPWAELVLPAARLAAEGFEVDAELAQSIAGAAAELARCDAARAIFLHQDGAPLAAGERLVQKDLAHALEAIAAEGAGAFYRGGIAERIAAAAAAGGGILTRADFAAYRAILREPLRGEYRGHEILAAPPPTAGGAVLIEALNQLEGFDLAALPPESPTTIHLLAESLRRAFLDRARFLGDADFGDVPLERLLSAEHAGLLRASIDPARASSSSVLAGDLDGTLPPEADHTTHFSIVDCDGNAVANTYTLEEAWGAKTIAPGTGIVLNNEMHDFNLTPGRSARSGAVGTEPNQIAPGKRMLSSMCPAIVMRRGKVFLVAGSPGGRTIPATVLRVVTAMVDHRLGPRAALELARAHHGLFPDRILLEERAGLETAARLAAMGHRVERAEHIGDCHAIGIDPATGVLLAVADGRRAGAAASAVAK